MFLLIWLMNNSGTTSNLSFLAKPLPRLCGWFAEEQNITSDEISGNLSYFKSQGIQCVNYMTDIPKYERAAKIGQQIGIQIYAWLPAMLGVGNNKKWIYENHPEAYVVTKSGIHSYYQPVYGVSHYKFLCPNQPIVRNYLKQMYDNVSRIPEIDGINLDYIRFIEENLRDYDPNGDTCYCEYCVSDYFNKTGVNISTNNEPHLVQDWADYRVNVITSLVNEIAKIVHSNGKRLSADVYPGPWQSTRQTRQKWNEWDLDMVFPMIYTQIFAREVSWIGPQTGEGVATIKEAGRKTALYTGLQAGVMTDDEFRQGVKLALENGAYGLSAFTLTNINPEKFVIMRNETAKFLEKKLNGTN